MLRTIGMMIFLASSAQAQMSADAVYRGDTRQELHEVQDARILRVADATASVFDLKNLKRQGNEYLINTTPMSQAMKICSDERFADQPSAADCSAVLIAPDRVLTAGHCLNAKTCATTAFAFGFAMKDTTGWPDRFSADAVYTCKRIVSRSNTESLDYAVIELDRSVQDRRPVEMASSRVSIGDQVFLLSHPAGVPLKYSPPNQVLTSRKNRFMAEIDALGGSSGGPVFSAVTHELVGILVAGEEDYVKDKKKNCRRVLECEPGQCTGEESTHVDVIRMNVAQ